ncbi:MAG: efflux RND transporter periplasmic adaptor subunit [Planctomycetota bacterium]|jgi:RND family efflux transporter MFP subunit
MRTDYRAWAIALVLLITLFGCKKEEPASAIVRPVRAMRVADAEQIARRVFPGRAEAVQAVDIAFEVQGQMIERPVNVGDNVEMGQVLAQLDPRDYQNDLDSAQAQMDRAKAYFERIEQAAETGAVAQQDLTDAQAQFDVAQANLNVKKKALTDTKIVAPFDGSIAATYLENFQNVRRKQSVLRLLDTSRIEMKIDIPEQLITLVPYVGDITVSFDAFPGKKVAAEMKEIGTEASATTRTYPVTVIMDQPEDFTILPGMTGQVRGRPDVDAPLSTEGVQVLGSAVFEKDGNEYVWVLDESSNTVKQHQVKMRSVNAQGVFSSRDSWLLRPVYII